MNERYLILAHWFVSGLAVYVTSAIVPGFKIFGIVTACIAAVLIGAANYFVWPILIILTLPINFLTLGLFTFVVNGAILKMAAAVMPGFTVKSWWAAILGSIVLSLTNVLFHAFLV